MHRFALLDYIGKRICGPKVDSPFIDVTVKAGMAVNFYEKGRGVML